MMSAVTVIIPSWQGAKLLARTLPTVLQQKEISYSVIVVENGIADDTATLVKKFQDSAPNLQLLSLEKNQGYAGGVNAGIQAATTSLVAVLCNDNEVDPYWLKNLLAAYGDGQFEGKKIAAVMSQSTLPGLNTSVRGTLNFLGRNVQFPDLDLSRKPLPIFYPGGNAFLLDKTLIDEPFDPSYFTYQEDVSFGWRLRNLGYEILYHHNSIARSFDGGTTKKVAFRTAFLTERNRLLNLLSYLELSSILKLFPFWFLDAIASALFGKNSLAKLKAHAWMLLHISEWHSRRNRLQTERKVSDQESLRTMSAKIFSEPCSKPKWLVNQFMKFYLKVVGIPCRL